MSEQDKESDTNVQVPLDAAALAEAVGLRPTVVLRLYRIGVIEAEAEPDGQPHFTAASVLRLRRALRIRRDLHISWNGLGVICDLLDRIEGLEAQLRAMVPPEDLDVFEI